MRLCEIAPGVHWLALGTGFRGANVYFVQSGASWSLVDAGWSRDGSAIRRAAASLFGRDARPASILLTHDHPDHAGAARELAQLWDCPVLLHADELPLAAGDVEAIQRYAGPLDRWVILPLLRLAGSRRREALLSQDSLKDVARALGPDAGLPGLPGWEAVHTPGHTPGHVAFFRREDGVAITGDALVTVDLNSVRGIVLREQRPAAPPWYTTWDWQAAKASVTAVARLAPGVLAGGHGVPMTGGGTGAAVRDFAERFGI